MPLRAIVFPCVPPTRLVSTRLASKTRISQGHRSGYSTSRRGGATTMPKVLSLETLHANIKQAEYAVRGELAIRAVALEKILSDPSSKEAQALPFDRVISCNIGNPQQLGQVPITFFRQVLSLIENAHDFGLIHSEADAPNAQAIAEKHAILSKLYPSDAIERAKAILKGIGPFGAYSHSMGAPYIRKHVAEFIEERDGFPADADKIFLTAGASSGIEKVMKLVVSHPDVGYPLYSATMTLLGGKIVPYYLNESDWEVNIATMEATIIESREKGIDVRAIVIINPGNPTGSCYSRETLQEIVQLASRQSLVLLADEVYQTNIYAPEERPFLSIRHILKSMGTDFEHVELFSFHSTSKGIIGECGRRGGYLECTGIDPLVMEQLYKIVSIGLCPNISGQVMMDLMLKPPVTGDASYPRYRQEMDDIFESLRRRANMLCEAFNKLENVHCNVAKGAMYIFPRIVFPERAIEAAKAKNRPVDAFYAMEMLNHTGVCVVPGSGFGQNANTFHIRATFLPLEANFPGFIERISAFHQEFMNKYRD